MTLGGLQGYIGHCFPMLGIDDIHTRQLPFEARGSKPKACHLSQRNTGMQWAGRRDGNSAFKCLSTRQESGREENHG